MTSRGDRSSFDGGTFFADTPRGASVETRLLGWTLTAQPRIRGNDLRDRAQDVVRWAIRSVTTGWASIRPADS